MAKFICSKKLMFWLYLITSHDFTNVNKVKYRSIRYLKIAVFHLFLLFFVKSLFQG